MDLPSRPQSSPGRFERFSIVFPILLAGWVPSILTLVVSYTILSNTLESKILRDRQTFVQLIGHLIGDDLSRTSGIIEYYQTLPDIPKILSSPTPTTPSQQWLASAFYSHPRIDGMFITNAEGRLIGSLPANPAAVGHDFESGLWKDRALTSETPYVSPVHPRLSDKRMTTDIVGPVKAQNGSVVGYFGVSVLVERIGRRLSTIEFADQQVCQVIDQNGVPLFATKFGAHPVTSPPRNQNLINEIGKGKRSGHLERDEKLYSFCPVESTGWMVVVEQPRAVAYKPIHDLVKRMALLTAWLMALTLAFAMIGGRLYRSHVQSARKLEREAIFNEKILANMPTGIAFVDPASHRFAQANEAFAQMAQRFGGFEGRDITEATYDDVNIAPPGAIERVLSFGTPFQLIEHPFQDREGVTHFVNINLLRLQSARQNVEGVLYLVEDRTRDVALRQELINANTAKDQFLALLSHELRNPLSPVLATVTELQETLPNKPEFRQALDVIRRNVELEARLIDDLLDVTRISRGKLQLTFEVISVHEVLQRAYEICREEIVAKKIAFEFQPLAGDSLVKADPARLQQVFWNLIKNSVKFTPGSGKIVVQTGNPVPGEIEITVRDTGLGIEPEKIDKVFNAFEQGQTSITRRFGGLGLGLAISKAMVDAHGGTIRADSKGHDQGSTFTVTLRTTSMPQTISTKPPRSETPKIAAGTARHLLLVDDHPDTCAGMKTMLERRGYNITVAHSANQAMEAAKTTRFDLLISDIGLPDRSGYELMQELHAAQGLRGIALSGFGTANDIDKARDAGFCEHLTKPITFERLEEAIRQSLEPGPANS